MYMPKYDIEKRKEIATIINELTIYPCILKIGKIIAKDKIIKQQNYVVNDNGFFIRVDRLSDSTFSELEKYINGPMKKELTKHANNKKVYKSSIFNSITEDDQNYSNMRMSSKEKKFIKKMRFSNDQSSKN